MRLATATVFLLSLIASSACAQQPTASKPAARTALASSFTAEAPSQSKAPDLKWGPAPPVFPAGAQMAVLQGNPGGTGMFAVRLRMPSGYKIAPHTHPTDEHVTVIKGTFLVGMGTSVDRKSMLTVHSGGFVTAPADHPHYAVTEGQTEVQVHAMGPFALKYVNPADDPQAAKK
jgi:quercetin dioxygenase-like cupin family protein